MSNYYIIGQRSYDMELQMSLNNLIKLEQKNILASGKSASKQEEIVLYSLEDPNYKNEHFPDFSHIFYLNQTGKDIFDSHSRKIKELLGSIEENELPRNLNLIVRNTRFM
ncbi:hypothetical protein ACE3MZ_16035 [Paenibacillus sp. WLX1005]|uniref:hypothetical protein n=1 Tax=Paenibacillus sp. WLX1005 TaxID=3243766 RepID=UPI0039844565